MKVKNVIFEDFINFKFPSLFIGFPQCSFKCNLDCGQPVCQNYLLSKDKTIDIEIDDLIDNYILNPITHAVVCGGLEPFDTWEDLRTLVDKFRIYTTDPIVIYTGYTEKEVQDKIEVLKNYENIIVKFGRFIPDKEPHMDKVLGVKLASPNQYAKEIS
jgi:organic radical activating enzyme